MENANKSLRILHLSAGNMLGGVESVLLTLAEFAGSCPKLQQEFALAYEGRLSGLLRQKGAMVRLLPPPRLRNPLSVRQSRSALMELLTGENYNAVISHSPWCQAIYGSAARRAGVPLVFWMHNSFNGHWLEKLASRSAPDLAICNSGFTANTLGRVYPRSTREVVYCPVRPSRPSSNARERLRKSLAVKDDTVVILMASRADGWKGHFNLVRAAEAIKSRKDWKVWIAGAPQTPAEKKFFAVFKTAVQRSTAKDRIYLLGQRGDIADLMHAADIYCQPNREPEPFGVVFVEALQAGLPVVTFSMGGAREILDQNYASLVEPGNVAGITAVLEHLIEDVELRTALGSAGPERARVICDPERQIRRMHQVLQQHLTGVEQ